MLKIIVLIILIFSSWFSFSFAQTPDYYKPYAPIYTDKQVYTWTDKVRITIVAPSWNSDKNLIDTIGGDNDNPIKISTRNHSLEPYRLTETGPNSGIFTGEVILTGFSHDANGDGKIDTTPRTFGSGSTGGFLETDRDGAITITFEFAKGVTLTKSALINWNVGEVFFLADQFFPNDQVVVRVIDPDMNLNPQGIDRVPIKITSSSDSAGIIADGIEISEEAGVFEAKIFFSKTSPSSGNRLYATPSDLIFARYDDHTLPGPNSKNDNLEIISQSRLESNIPPLERILLSDIRIADSTGKSQKDLKKDNQLQIVGAVRNEQEFDQDFVFLIQVTDENKKIVSLSWISGNLEKFQKLDVSQSWIPDVEGEYNIQIFVWDSLYTALPLANSQSQTVLIK